jgi:hypothetical protein
MPQFKTVRTNVHDKTLEEGIEMVEATSQDEEFDRDLWVSQFLFVKYCYFTNCLTMKKSV